MMMMLFVGSVVLLLAAASANSHPEEASPHIRVDPPVNLAVNASNQFAFSLFEYLLQNTTEKNTILSGISLSSALAMLFLGSRGVTESELSQALEYKKYGLDQTTVHGGFRTLLERFGSRGNEAYNLTMVNLVLVQNGFPIVRDYQTLLNDFYQARIQNVDFDKEGEATMNKVNEFVAHTTRNQISSVLTEPLDKATKAFIMNAVYFKGEWRTRFDQRFTRPSTFYESGLRPKTIPMMNIKSKFPLYISEDIEALELDYKGDDLSMLVLLPKQRDGLPELEKKVLKNPGFLDEMRFQEVIVDVSLPRYTLESKIDLIEPLISLGAPSAFDYDRADLSGICGQRGLYVTKAIHQAVFKVDEEGSEASAFSGIATGIRIGGPPAPMFVVDHPFMFFVRDKSTGTVLFMGRINDPYSP